MSSEPSRPAELRLAENVVMTGYDPLDDDQVAELAVMYSHYQLEELDRTGRMAFGLPVASYLLTFWIRSEGQLAGFVSLDVMKFAVELVYVTPEFRGRGLAVLAVAELARDCPRPFQLKGPLSPGGQAIASSLGLGRADHTPDEAAANARTITDIHRLIAGRCQHGRKRKGDPRRVCKRCYQGWLREYAAQGIITHANEARKRAVRNEPSDRPARPGA